MALNVCDKEFRLLYWVLFFYARVDILCSIMILHLDLESVAEMFQSHRSRSNFVSLGKTTVSTFLIKHTVKHEFRARDEFNILSGDETFILYHEIPKSMYSTLLLPLNSMIKSCSRGAQLALSGSDVFTEPVLLFCAGAA